MLLRMLNKPQWISFVSIILVATVFFIPISPSLKSIFVVLSALCILITPIYRRDLSFAFSETCCIAAMVFFLLIAVACLWSPASYQIQLIFLGKYSKLLFLPIFAVGFQKRSVRLLGIYAFLSAMVISCLLSILNNSSDPGEVFHNHILTSSMMAFASYLTGLLAFRQVGFARRLPFLLLILLFSYQLIFVNAGRAGYLVFFVLMIMLLVQHLPLKQMIAGILCFCILFAFCSYQSTVFSERMQSVVENWHDYQHGQVDTSIGFRFMFHDVAKTLFISSPWRGHGTGGFAHAFQKENTFDEWKKLLDPHSQYWLVASDLGLLGLGVLFVFFVTLAMTAFRLNEMKPVMLGILVSLCIGNLTDSLLFHSAVGYLFIVFNALCLGELVEKRANRMAEDKGTPQHSASYPDLLHAGNGPANLAK